VPDTFKLWLDEHVVWQACGPQLTWVEEQTFVPLPQLNVHGPWAQESSAPLQALLPLHSIVHSKPCEQVTTALSHAWSPEHCTVQWRPLGQAFVCPMHA
jgi:hypothetical protein